MTKPEVSGEDVEELLRQAEVSALPEASGALLEGGPAPLSEAEPVFRPYKGIKFTVSAGPTKEAARSARDQGRDSGFWKIDTDSTGDDVIDSLFSEVFGEEESAPPPAPPRPVAPPPEPQPLDVEETSIDLAALGFDPGLAKRRPGAESRSRGRLDAEPDRPELLWADMELDEPEAPGSPTPVEPAPAQRPAASLRRGPGPRAGAGHGQSELAETQKLRTEDIQAAIAAQRMGVSEGQQTAEPVSRARVLRAQGRLVEARHLLHRYIKENPEDTAAEEEFRRIQHELRVHCSYQLRNEGLVPQLQLPPSSPHLQALFQAPAGGVLRRVNGAATLRDIRKQLELEPKEFERHMISLLEWGFVTLTSRKRPGEAAR